MLLRRKGKGNRAKESKERRVHDASVSENEKGIRGRVAANDVTSP